MGDAIIKTETEIDSDVSVGLVSAEQQEAEALEQAKTAFEAYWNHAKECSFCWRKPERRAFHDNLCVEGTNLWNNHVALSRIYEMRWSYPRCYPR